MKKFTKFWQLMMVILLSSSIAFAQTTVQDAQKGVAEKGYLLKQKQMEKSAIKVTPDGDKVQISFTDPNIKDQAEVTLEQKAIAPTSKARINSNDLRQLPGSPDPSDAFNWQAYAVSGEETHLNWPTPERATFFEIYDFCLEGPVTIEQVSHLFYEHPDYLWPDATFHFKIYDADGVTLLHESGDLEAQNYVEYFYTIPGSIAVTNDFWVAVVPVDASGHPSSMSTDGHWGHSYTGSAGAWTVYDGYEFITGAYVEGGDAGPRLAVGPDPFDFGPVSLGNSPTQIFTIENYCPAGGSITLDPAPDLTGDAAFTIISDNGAPYPTDIPADQTTVEIEVQFTPTSEQAYSTVLNIYDNLTDNTTSVNITGNGVAAFDCVWEICLHDDYGDGWNGNSLDVFSDGVLVLDDITLAGGTGPVCFTFGVNDGATFSTVYTGTAAQWDYENFYYIYDHMGIEVATDPDEPVHGVDPPNGLTDIPTYCGTCPGPTDVYADNYGPTTADANWTDAAGTGLYDIVWGLYGFDPDAGPFTGTMYGYVDPMGGPYTYPMTGFDWALAPYEFYVRTDCGTDETSPWISSGPIIPPPPNDECFNAQPVVGPYPVTGILGTTLGATISCPGVLDMASGDVWYAIDLPYSMNTVVLDLCGDALLNNGWIVATDVECSCDLLDYYYADSWDFAPPCVYDLTWIDIPGPTTLYYPVATGDFQENFTLDVDVIEQQVIYNDFWVTLDPAGGYVDGGGTDYYGDGWYYYPESTFWNIWFYDHPYDITRYKEIHIEIIVDAFDPGFPTYLEFVVNWSTDEWSLVGNPLPEPRVPPLPPLTLPEEDLYIGRELLVLIDYSIVGPEPYVFDFVLPDYNPEWVSIDVLGENFVVEGFIIHECLPKPDPPPPNDDCEDAILIGGSFPQTVPGTTTGATVDCPGVLDWLAVWYEIELPYECNFVQLDLCVPGTTLSNTGIILTADCSCDPASFIYSTGDWTVSGPCINELNFLVEGPGTVYYPVMVEPQGDFIFDIDVTELYSLDGYLTYDNLAMSAMQVDQVTIDDGSKAIVGTTYTDLYGYYEFICLESGTYILDGSTNDDWGGLSMNDVQLARQHVAGVITLTGLKFLAADVNWDGAIAMLDVQTMRQRVAGTITSWTAPDYIFENPSVGVPADATQNFQTICSGDVDGSYTPPPAPPGSVCGNAIPLGYSGGTTSVINQTNCGLGNFYDNTCLGYYDGGEDIIYELTVTGDWTVNITMDPKGTTYTGFLIADDCPDVGTCLDFSTNSGGTAHSIEGLALTAGTYYIMVDTWPSPDCIPDFDLTIEEWVPSYCISGVGPTSTYDSNVETVDITGDAASAIAYLGCTNPTGGGGWLGVEDLTATMSVDVTIGLAYSIDVTFGTCGGSYSGAGEVWIDWNQNFTFDAGESIGTWSGSPPSLQTFNFTVPAGATTGATRMRVMQREAGSNPLDPCGGYTWGSVVDFTVNVN